MKALLIADDEKAITNISEVLKSAGYDVIVYKWLLKAMDNLEEIKPHLIVVSTKDYPRHWKTLAQYSSNIKSDYRPEMILYSPEKLSDEELKKAETLRVRGIFESIEVEGLDKLREILSKKPDIFSGYLTDPEPGEVTLKDLIPELDEQNLKTISEDINSLKEELNKPFDINEAIAELEKAKEKESDSNQDSTRINTDEKDIKDSGTGDSNQDSTQMDADEKGLSEIDFDDENSADEAEEAEAENPDENEEITQDESELEELKSENSDKNEEITQDEVKSDEKLEEFAPETETEAEIEELESENPDEPDENEEIAQDENQDEEKNLEAEPESDIIEEDKNQKSEDDEISENENEQDSEPKDEKMNEEDIEAKLAAIMNANKADAKEKAEEAGIDNYSCSFVFTNPITLALVTGTARNYNGMTLEFMPDIPNFIMNLAPDTQISDASLKVNGEISDVKAEVMSNDAKKLYLQIKK